MEELFAIMQEDVANSHILSDSYLAQIKKCYKNDVVRLITDEIATAHTEGTPTSRLTSLYNKVVKL